jgi:hypothetical protein
MVEVAMSAPGGDRAIVSITKWARRDEWCERLELIIDAHFGPILAAIDLPVEDLPEILGEGFSALFGCVLEDFVSCDFGPDQRSIVDDYLKRRGFREPAPVKSYLRALRRSVMSAYQVVATAPGSHIVLRDLIRDGEPIRVEDRLGAQSLAPGDHVAARLLPINGKIYPSAGVLCLPADRAPQLVKDIRRLCRKVRRGIAREAKQRGIAFADLEAVIALDDVTLGELAPIFTQVWLTAALEQLLDVVLTDKDLAGAAREEDAAEDLLTIPVPALGGKSPRQAARSRDGRRRVAQWLKYQEARSPGQAGSELAAPAHSDLDCPRDLSWMWQALKIEHLR